MYVKIKKEIQGKLMKIIRALKFEYNGGESYEIKIFKKRHWNVWSPFDLLINKPINYPFKLLIGHIHFGLHLMYKRIKRIKMHVNFPPFVDIWWHRTQKSLWLYILIYFTYISQYNLLIIVYFFDFSLCPFSIFFNTCVN